jgi:hypothetical protein
MPPEAAPSGMNVSMNFPRPKNFSYVDLDDIRVIDDINNHLNVKLSEPMITPYVALERARKVLAPYGIVIPAVAWMNSDEGEQVFPVSQWNGIYGTRGVASVDTNLKTNPTYSAYFSWAYVPGKNAYDIYCALVTQEELQDLLSTDFDGSPVPYSNEKDTEEAITYPNVNAAVFDEEKKKLVETTNISLIEATKAFVARTENAYSSLILAEDDDPCWDNYRMVGMKKKGGREVPNCVPKKGVPKMRKEDNMDEALEIRHAINHPDRQAREAAREHKKALTAYNAGHAKLASQYRAPTRDQEDELMNHYEVAAHHHREYKKRLAQLDAGKNEDLMSEGYQVMKGFLPLGHPADSGDDSEDGGDVRYYHVSKNGKKVGELVHGTYFGSIHGTLHGKRLPDIGQYNGQGPDAKLHRFLKSNTGKKWASNLHKYQQTAKNEDLQEVSKKLATKVYRERTWRADEKDRYDSHYDDHSWMDNPERNKADKTLRYIGRKFGNKAAADAERNEDLSEADDAPHPKGTRVVVSHKGHQKPGRVIRHDKGGPDSSPFYIVDVGEYGSGKFMAHQVKKEDLSEAYDSKPHPNGEHNSSIDATSKELRKAGHRITRVYHNTPDNSISQKNPNSHVSTVFYQHKQLPRSANPLYKHVITPKKLDDIHETSEMAARAGYASRALLAAKKPPQSKIDKVKAHLQKPNYDPKKHDTRLRSFYGSKTVAAAKKQLSEDLSEAAWQRKEGKNPEGGLNRKGVESYRRENPGSKLQMAVTTKPSKLKPGSKAANRRKSFCARMGGMEGPMKDEKGRPTRKALSLRKWNC